MVGQMLSAKQSPIRSAQLGADDRYEGDHLAGVAPEIVYDGELAVVGDAPVLGRLASELEPALVVHAQAGSAHGVPEALQTAIGVDGQAAVECERPRQDFLPRRPPFGEAEILHQ